MYQEIVTSFCSRCQVVSTELFPPIVVVPSAKSQFSSFGAKTYRHTAFRLQTVLNNLANDLVENRIFLKQRQSMTKYVIFLSNHYL